MSEEDDDLERTHVHVRRHPDGGWTPIVYVFPADDDEEVQDNMGFEPVSSMTPSWPSPDHAWKAVESSVQDYHVHYGYDCWDEIPTRSELWVYLKHLVECPWDTWTKCADCTHRHAEETINGH